MKVKVIGSGAAGNKATITAIKNGVLKNDDYLLINSTLRDIPVEYRSGNCLELLDSTGGCAKERDLAYELTVATLKDRNTIDLFDRFIDEETECVVIVTSTSGGTGSGSTTILAKWIRKQYDIPVHIFALTGFEEDIIELANTVNFFNELDTDFTIEALSNKKYLGAGVNKIAAEKAANEDFAMKLSVITGNDLIDSEQNLDDTELYETVNNPGYMLVEKAELNKIKNVEAFNKVVSNMIDETKSLDTTKGITRLGVILNIKEDTREYIDYSFEVIKNKLGNAMYIFPHIQYDEKQPEYIAIMAAGMKLPKEELQEMYDKFEKKKESLSNDEDDFFETLGSNRAEISRGTSRRRGKGRRANVPVQDIDAETGDDDFFAQNKPGTIANNF